jgi:hypothetical protein
LSPPIRSAASACVFTTIVLVSIPAFCDSVLDRCVDADTRAQSLRQAGMLGEAREQLKRCADASCPSLVRADCTQLLDDLDRAQPTVVFDVKDDTGHDLADVNVQIDGHPFANRLEGVALPADPGAHVFTFEAPGRSPVTRQIVVKEGEKSRRESIVLRSPGSSVTIGVAASPPNALMSPARAPAEGIGTQKVSALIVGAFGVVALGAGGALALVARSKNDDANAFCPGLTCSNPQALNMNREALTWGDAATVAIVSGAVGVGAAAALWLTARPSSNRSSVSVGLDATSVAVRGSW